MSWLKFWKSSKKDPRSRSEIAKSEAFNEEFSSQAESEKDKNARLRHSMSISRSGRFKQKNKQRSGILDQPEFFADSNANDSQKENRERTPHPASTNRERTPHPASTNFEHKRTPPSTCREVSSRQNIANHRFEGQTTVL